MRIQVLRRRGCLARQIDSKIQDYESVQREKGLANFEGKSDFPGRPMLYGTIKKFLEIFGLRNLKELPTLNQIDELLPEEIGEDELKKIQSQLEEITTSSDFVEQEKQKQREKKDLEKAQNIREALALGEAVGSRDLNWLKKYDEALAAGSTEEQQAQAVADNEEALFEEEGVTEELPEIASDEELEGV